MKKKSLSNFNPHNHSTLSNNELKTIHGGGDNERLGSGQQTVFASYSPIYSYLS